MNEQNSWLFQSHQQPFEHRNLDASAMQREQSIGLHLVESMADVESAVVEFGSQLGHQDIESLRTGRIEAPREEEACDALAQRLRGTIPGTMAQALGTGGKDVEHVETEHKLSFQEQQHFLLVDGDEVARSERLESRRIALRESEKLFRLNGVWCIHHFADATSMIVADGLDSNGTRSEEDKMVADVALLDNPPAFSLFGESKLGVTHYLHQVGMAHALKESELQQLVV